MQHQYVFRFCPTTIATGNKLRYDDYIYKLYILQIFQKSNIQK